jgi:hypothetical protein
MRAEIDTIPLSFDNGPDPDVTTRVGSLDGLVP